MTTIQKRDGIARWAGPLSDIIDAGKLAISTMRDWSGEEPPCEVEVAFLNETRRDYKLELLERNLDTRELSSIRSIRIKIGGDQGPLTFLHLRAGSQDNAPAVALEVTGPREGEVDGLLQGLRRIFSRGRQRPGAGILMPVAVGAAIRFLVLALSAPAWLGYEDSRGALSGGGIAIGIILALMGLALVAGLATMHPFLELLPPAGKPKRARWSAGAWSLFALLFTSGLGVYLSTRP